MGSAALQMGLINVALLRTSVLEIQRLKPGNGGLVLGPRPGKRSKARLGRMALSHVCTLLSEHEEPTSIRDIAQQLGCAWVWLPIEGGSFEILKRVDIEQMVSTLAESIAKTSTPKVYLHCAGGIHRTGFFASVLLRLQPVDDVAAVLAALRLVTAEQLGADRLGLAITQAEELLK